MSERDELVTLIRQVDFEPGRSEPADAADLADVILAAGYRKVTATPEQLLAAAAAIRDVCDIYPPPVTEPADWLGEAKAAARAFGLSVAEDGEQ